jgi:hypothetical protein
VSRSLAQRLLFCLGALFLLSCVGGGARAQVLQPRAEDVTLGGIGYSPVPLQATQVTLVTERVDVTLAPTYANVHTSLTLHNPAADVVLPIGFPQDQPRPGSRDDVPQWEDLRADVDGERMPLTFEGYADELTAPGLEGWYTVLVPFEADQTRVLEASYRVRNTFGAEDEAYFQYNLSTSATWPHPIDAVTVTVTLTDTLTWDHLLGVAGDPSTPGSSAQPAGIIPPGYERLENQIQWHWVEVEPNQGHNLVLAFYRRPVRVHGQAEALLTQRQPEPERPDSSVPSWVPLGLILVVVLVLAGVVGRSRGDPWRLDS